jgi:hypothetical protein
MPMNIREARIGIPIPPSPLRFEIIKPDTAPATRNTANDARLIFPVGFLPVIRIAEATNDKAISDKNEKTIPKSISPSGVVFDFIPLCLFIIKSSE